MNSNSVPEWITRSQADSLMIGVLILGLVLAGVAFVLARGRGGNPIRAAVVFGGPAILAGLLWHLYNFITNQFGLTSVTNLLVNLALFVAVGVGMGLLLRGKRFSDRSPSGEIEPGPHSPVAPSE